MRWRDDLSQATPHDLAEVAAFRRFLELGVGPDEPRRFAREFPGWLPYLIGGPAPPVGYDDVPQTAWPMPG